MKFGLSAGKLTACSCIAVQCHQGLRPRTDGNIYSQRYDQKQYLPLPVSRNFYENQSNCGRRKVMKKENENATKLAKGVATLRKSGLTVTDETKKGGSIGITGVHDHFKNGKVPSSLRPPSRSRSR
jgi:hypothetical protein